MYVVMCTILQLIHLEVDEGERRGVVQHVQLSNNLSQLSAVSGEEEREWTVGQLEVFNSNKLIGTIRIAMFSGLHFIELCNKHA